MQDSTQVKNRLNLRFVILILCLLALGLGLGIAGKNAWSNYKTERETIKNKINALSEKQQVISDLESKLERAEKDMRILLDAKPTENEQQKGVTQVKDAYLLARIAEDRLQYANDIQTAKQLLQLAQDHLANLNEPAIVQAKAVLAADQARLNSLSYPDIREAQEKLVIMDKLINLLPLKKSAADEALAKVDSASPQKTMRFDKEWKQSLNKMLEDLKTVVKIKKKGDVDAERDLSYVNTEISKAQFKLLIEQIRWAIFYRDEVVYSRSVRNAQELLVYVFDNNNEDVRQFSDTLNYLAGVKIQPNAPSIKDSVSALQAILVG